MLLLSIIIRPPHHNVPVQNNRFHIGDNAPALLQRPALWQCSSCVVEQLRNKDFAEIKAYEIKAGDPPILDISEAWPLGFDKSFEVHVNPKLSSDKIALGSVKKLLAL
ncbi:hypothetical protein MP228_003153 [Amoeboaphelidium protococcarum]|nr:hypothetical protein MP228_003153 [Amoeboaphelidium protococcarum]